LYKPDLDLHSITCCTVSCQKIAC